MDILELLQYTFFRHALLGSLFASIACGIIGTYIVTRRLVFISGGITHASFGGIGLGLYAGISPLLSAAVFSVLSAFGVEWLSKRKDMREDSAIAVFWTFGMAVGYARNKKIQKKIESGELQAAPEIVEADAECCGQHEICEKESLLAAVSKKVEYYDDEELDRFRGHSSDGYSEEEIEEFREVMYTCKEDEVAGWSRSLQLRGIELPDELKDELFLIVGERRFK